MTDPLDSGMVRNASEPPCVALTQTHRGHGVSAAAYYLGRALVAQERRVLLGDLSQRVSPIAGLAARQPLKNLVPWTPPAVASRDLPLLLRKARERTAGHAEVALLDLDAGALEHSDGMDREISYIALFTEQTPEAERAAMKLAERLVARDRWLGRVGVIFSRVEPPRAEALPAQLDDGTPVLGWLPADYALAAGEAYSLKGGEPARPHEAYLNATIRLAQVLCRLVPIARRVCESERTEHARTG